MTVSGSFWSLRSLVSKPTSTSLVLPFSATPPLTKQYIHSIIRHIFCRGRAYVQGGHGGPAYRGGAPSPGARRHRPIQRLQRLYFAAYRAVAPRRRLGALALVLVNLAFLVQSLYLGLLPYLIGESPLGLPSEAKLGLLAAAFPLAAFNLITLLVLRQMTARRRR